MIDTRQKDIRKIVRGRAKGYLSLLILLTMVAVAFSGCRDQPAEFQSTEETQDSVVIDGIIIPILPSSEEQFNYTHSWFAGKQVERAALQAYIQLYPENKRNCGLAALDLAYLELGEDYRFASDEAYYRALEAYNLILTEYTDFPEIMAKALWYRGWIFTDLLYDRQKGLASYRRVAEEYPHESVSLLPPAPWVSIIYPMEEHGDNAGSEQQGNSWAALALLEIVKHTEEPDAAWESFEMLWENYGDDVATGFALKHVLKRQYHADEAKAMASEFMEKNLSNIFILSDLRRGINAIESARGETVNED